MGAGASSSAGTGGRGNMIAPAAVPAQGAELAVEAVRRYYYVRAAFIIVICLI